MTRVIYPDGPSKEISRGLTCPKVKCDLVCSNGLKSDGNGCATCACAAALPVSTSGPSSKLFGQKGPTVPVATTQGEAPIATKDDEN